MRPFNNLMFFVLIGLVSCGTHDTKNTDDAGAIVFITTPVQSQSLLARPTLKCYPGEQRLELNLKIESLVPEKITITEIVLNNAQGLNSSAESIAGKTFSIRENGDTTLLLTFNHVNDKSLFQATGLPGLIDSSYNVSVFYSVEGREDVRVINLVSRMPKETFLSYKKSYRVPIQIYSLNTQNGFDEKLRKYLKAKAIAESPFVHITEQELAVSGLNFRTKGFHRNDSLHVEIFVVNHSDLTIKIDTSKIDMTVDSLQREPGNTELRIEKVTGSKAEVDILRKGDRVVIKMRKQVHDDPKRLWLTLAEAFSTSAGNLLFNDDLELIRQSNTILD